MLICDSFLPVNIRVLEMNDSFAKKCQTKCSDSRRRSSTAKYSSRSILLASQ
jgi:hypothetical protein